MAESAAAPATVPSRTFGPRDATALLLSAGHPARLVAFLAVAVVAGILEATVILIVVAIAATLAEGTDAVTFSLGALDVTLSRGDGLLLGVLLTLLLVAVAVPNAWLGARMGADVLARTRTRLFRGLVAARWEQQSSVSEPWFQDLAAVHAFRVGNLVLLLTVFITNVVGLLALMIVALLIDPVTALTLLAIVGLLGVIFRPLVRSVRHRSELHVAEHHQYVGELSNAFRVLPEIRIFGVRAAAGDAIEAVNERTGRQYRHMMFRGRLLPSLYLAATAGLLLAGLAVAGTQDDLDTTQVGAIVVFVLRALRYSQQVQGGWQGVMEHIPYLNQVQDALAAWGAEPASAGSRTLRRAGTLELRDATYVYPTGQVGVEGVSVVIQPGEIIGLEGPSGAGKSTVAQLLLGLRHPTIGEYLADGLPVEEYDEVSWFSRFAYVAQDSRLIDGDIRDNVRFLRPEISDAAIDRALEEAGIGPDLLQWKGGAGHQVGAGGRELSGGQRQRVAIARALAGEPDVLVMDEPTSALDRESEDIVRTTLLSLKGRITVVLIAHRESTLTVCDRVLHVRHHRVEEVSGATS